MCMEYICDFFLQMDIAEKFPSFRLVMEFVQDPAWTTDRYWSLNTI